MNDPKDAKADSLEDSANVSGATPSKVNPVDRQRYPVDQPCDRCGKPVPVNAVSPSECFCSNECQDAAYNDE